MPAPRFFRFNVSCFGVPRCDAEGSTPVARLRVTVAARDTVGEIFAKLAQHSAAPSGISFQHAVVKGSCRLLDKKAIVEDVMKEALQDLEAFAGEAKQDQNDASEALELPVLRPCERVPSKNVPIEELIYRMADRVGLPLAKPREGRPYGVLRRIVATTKEYVESLKFCLRSRDVKLGEPSANSKEHAFDLEEDELVEEVLHVTVKDAPPNTLGVEIILRTSRRDLRITGAAASRAVASSTVERKSVKAPEGQQISSLLFQQHDLVGFRHQRSVPKYIKRRQKRLRAKKSESADRTSKKPRVQ